MTFQRLLRADVVAMVAALALLFVMAIDWYSTGVGDSARQIQKLSQTGQSNESDEAQRENAATARYVAESQEKNAWQESRLIDRLILLGLLATVALAVGAAFARAAGRRFEPPSTPTTAAAAAAIITALLVVYRIIQEPGFDSASSVKAGPLLALACLTVIALAGRSALAREADGSAWPEPSPDA